ncbi:MAG: alkylmercury lyase family protein, partial [Candidatus Binatia bacterium]
VLAAYPFSSTPTPHRVRLMGREVFALCAVDALGIPAMLRETAEISSRCAHCHTQVEVAVSVQGLGQYRPGDSVVWFPLGKDVCCPVAQSRCPEINFFCSTQHRDSWLQTRGGPEGLPLTMDEAFEVGREIFGALLAPPESTTR